MKPNDENGRLPPEKRPFRVLILAGSDRRQYNCSGVDSKARTLMLCMADKLPQEWEIDYEDQGNVFGGRAFKAAMPASQPPWRWASGLVIVMRRKTQKSRISCGT